MRAIWPAMNYADWQATRDVLGATRALGGEVTIDTRPQEVSRSVPLDEDEEHATYDPGQVGDYFAAATPPAPKA